MKSAAVIARALPVVPVKVHLINRDVFPACEVEPLPSLLPPRADGAGPVGEPGYGFAPQSAPQLGAFGSAVVTTAGRESAPLGTHQAPPLASGSWRVSYPKASYALLHGLNPLGSAKSTGSFAA